MSLTPDIVAGVSRRLAEHAGLELPAWVVEARASARINALGVAPSAYVDLIATSRGAGELATLIEAVRVGESSLFRHRPQVAALVDAIAPVLRNRKSVKVWSAGCASGEEPYTLAAVLSRALPGMHVSVVATDVSAGALAMAQAAHYPVEALEDVPDEWRDAFVADDDSGRVHVSPDIASLVTFERANLLDSVPPKQCDVVWCRNVLIYFSADARKKAIDRLISSLCPGGFLFVGYSETLRDIPELEARRHGDTVFYVKRERETTNPGMASPLEGVRTPPYGTRLPPAAKRVSMVRTAVAVPWSVEDPSDPRERTVISSVPPPPPQKKAVQLLALVGQPRAAAVIALVGERLSVPGVERVIIDLDPAELLEDALAPVLRRARAAASTAGVTLELRATKPGPKRWLSRHGLGDRE